MTISTTPSDSELQSSATNDIATSEIQKASHPKDDTSRESDANQHSTEQASQTSKDARSCTEGHEAGDDHSKPTSDKNQADEVEKTKVEEKPDVATDEPEQNHSSPASENEDLVLQVSAQLKSVTLNDESKGAVEDKEDEPLLEPKDVPRSESESKLEHGPDLPELENESKPELGAGAKSETGPESERKPAHEPEHESEPEREPESESENESENESEHKSESESEHESEREHAPQPDSEAELKSHEDKPQESLNETATEPATPTQSSVPDQPVRDSAQEQLSFDRQRLVLIFSYVDHLQVLKRRRKDTRACIAIKQRNNEQCRMFWDTRRYPTESHLCEVHKGLNFLGGHIFRSYLSEVDLHRFFFPTAPNTSIGRTEKRSEAIFIHHRGQDLEVFNEDTFEDLTSDVEPLVKANIWQLIVDYFFLVARHTEGIQVCHGYGSESYFARKWQYSSRYPVDARLLNAKGHVYTTLYNHYRENQEVSNATIALKIGFSTKLSGRLYDHSTKCGMNIKQLRTFPNIEEREPPVPFAYLFEKIVQEILIAHQHDVWCRCGSAHVEMFLFERIEGDHNGTHSYRKTMDRLAPTFEKWMRAFQDLEDLHTQLFGTSSDPNSLADVLRGMRL